MFENVEKTDHCWTFICSNTPFIIFEFILNFSKQTKNISIIWFFLGTQKKTIEQLLKDQTAWFMQQIIGKFHKISMVKTLITFVKSSSREAALAYSPSSAKVTAAPWNFFQMYLGTQKWAKQNLHPWLTSRAVGSLGELLNVASNSLSLLCHISGSIYIINDSIVLSKCIMLKFYGLP